jgi:hypothetical protein
MAAIIAGFDAAAFRQGIRTAMTLGLPVQPERQPQFVKVATPVLSGDIDVDGVPWDLTTSMAAAGETKTRVLCVIQEHERSEATKSFGLLQPGYIEVTLLDEEYAQIQGFDYVNLWPTTNLDAPVRYLYRRVLMQPNLDSVGVWILECATEDMV